MPRFSLATYRTLLGNANLARTNQRKGQTFEALIGYLFASLPGVEVRERRARTSSEEIDLVLWNERRIHVLKILENVILVECKNWTKRVGTPDVNWFATKLRNRGLMNGILVTRNGITEDCYRDGVRIIMNSLRHQNKIIVLTFAELKGLNSNADFLDLLKRKYCQLFIEKPF